MPQPSAPRPTPAADRAGAEPTVATPAKAAELTVNKVIAGAGAAATSAVLGSYFGASGTVAGAALGSVASTVATTLYQRSLDRTRDTIVARVRLTGGRRTDLSDTPTVQLAVPQPRVPVEPATTQLRVEPVLRRPRRMWVWAGATVLVFVIALLVVTGLEWAKGSSLTTGQPGTSVGRVLTPGSGGNAGNDPAEETSEEPTASAEPTTEPAPTEEETRSAEPTPSEEPGSGAGSTREPRTSGTPTSTPRPTPGLRIPDLEPND
ncbi:hypothetical protein [Pseudonocardia adelaidensis]|uniref:Uncharacterized protein n=1 Tax=Pseudonocardia adelaidensis TaxID=648754 RepID=A0ABP9NPJ2_9PSEU